MSALERNGFRTPNRWRMLKALLAALLYWLVCFAVLCLVYPFDRIGGATSSLSEVLPEYALLSFLAMSIVVLVVPLLTWWCNRIVIWMSVIIRTVAAFLVLFVLAAYINASDELRDFWPTSQIQSFFNEWRVFTLALVYVPIVSVLAGVYFWWIDRRKAVSPSSSKRFATRGRAARTAEETAGGAQSEISTPADP